MLVVNTHGLRCRVCDNAISDEDCRERGQMVECQPNQNSCYSEYRLTGATKLITRRCKQSHACQNNHNQNLRPAWMPTQCNDIQGSVCRCCCSTDECNDVELTSCGGQATPQKCKNPTLLNGAVSCNEEGTCSYICDPGYTRVGAPQTTCKRIDNNDVYDQEKPTCEPLCDSLLSPENGNKFCEYLNVENEVGTICFFECSEGYYLSDEYISTCELENGDRAVYDRPPPTCEKKIVKETCPEQTPLRRVKPNCSNQDKVGSTCTFTCEHEIYKFEPGSIKQNECLENGSWSSAPPCCRLPCPPHTVMDLIILLDSSSSVKLPAWKQSIQFATELISQLTVSYNMTKVFVLRYNKAVDEKNQILFENHNSPEEILQQLKTIPYDGRGTRTGKALAHIRDKTLKLPAIRKNVTDVVLLLTDGRASDDVSVISKKLRDDGVEMYAMGIGNIDRDELLEITGSPSRIWDGITYKDFMENKISAKTIMRDICDNSCK